MGQKALAQCSRVAESGVDEKGLRKRVSEFGVDFWSVQSAEAEMAQNAGRRIGGSGGVEVCTVAKKQVKSWIL